MGSATRKPALLLLFLLVACAVEPEAAPDLKGTWYVRGRTEVAYREQTPCFLTPGPCYLDSVARQCEWTAILSLAGTTGEYRGTYHDASSQCSDGYALPTAGDVTARITGRPFRLGENFPQYWPVTVQVGAAATAVLLDGAVVPPDSLYGASQFAGYAPACYGVGWCSRGSFVASQRALPGQPLGTNRRPP